MFYCCFAYNLVEERKKEEIREKNLFTTLNNFFHGGQLLDISGHKLIEVIIGIPFGLIASYLLDKIIF